MYNIRSTTPMTPVDGHVDIDFADRKGWIENMGATILPIMIGDDHCGPFVALSYVEPTNEQMPLSFAHAHASDNWRISVRGTTNMGRDAYEQGQFRFPTAGCRTRATTSPGAPTAAKASSCSPTGAASRSDR